MVMGRPNNKMELIGVGQRIVGRLCIWVTALKHEPRKNE